MFFHDDINMKPKFPSCTNWRCSC